VLAINKASGNTQGWRSLLILVVLDMRENIDIAVKQNQA
jgi:hypothetical protein